MGCLVSVIVPAYKVEKYLSRCIESIQKQTYSKLEIILVDDGSPDRCGEICDEYARKDSRIRVIHRKNGGLSEARNEGVSKSSGEYIVFVDSDDYIADRMIECLLSAVKQYNCKLGLCNFTCIDENGKSTGESLSSPIKNEFLDAREVLNRFYTLFGWCYIVAWNKIYHRSLLSENTFPSGRIHEDEFVAAQLIWGAEKIACIEYKGYYYVRQREGSITQIKNESKHLDLYFALIERYKFYQKIGCTDLLYETQARVYEVVKDYLHNKSKYDESYKEKIEMLFCQYENLTGMLLKDKVKRKLLKYNLKFKQLIAEIL